MEAAMEAVDRGEPTSAMEPLLIPDGSRHRAALNDLAFDLTRKSAGFRRSLPPPIQPPLASLVRAMNCYYSNLIEGHDTHPIDIERALRDDYSQDRKKRDLQIEAKAHMAVQQWIDEERIAPSTSLPPLGEELTLLVTDLPKSFAQMAEQMLGTSVVVPVVQQVDLV